MGTPLPPPFREARIIAYAQRPLQQSLRPANHRGRGVGAGAGSVFAGHGSGSLREPPLGSPCAARRAEERASGPRRRVSHGPANTLPAPAPTPQLRDSPDSTPVAGSRAPPRTTKPSTGRVPGPQG